jgi:hypothetical protein
VAPDATEVMTLQANEFLVGHRPSRVWRFGLALIKSSPLLGWGGFEVTHLHHRD